MTSSQRPSVDETAKRQVKIFFSYSHKDEKMRDGLENSLAELKRQGFISAWHDRKIAASTEWKGELDAQLEAADIILLLISADFLASDYCNDVEVERAMERHEKGEARVVPIILRACDWQHSKFAKLQALPIGIKPIREWRSRDKAFTEVAKGLRSLVESLQ